MWANLIDTAGWNSRPLAALTQDLIKTLWPASPVTCGDNETMWIGWIEFDILLGDVHSLKEKRSLVRPLVAELKRRFDVSAAETGMLDQHRRALVGAGVVAPDNAHLQQVLDAVERFVAARPEFELLSARRRELHSED